MKNPSDILIFSIITREKPPVNPFFKIFLKYILFSLLFSLKIAVSL